jgi:dihydroneopterin aldolase
MDKIHINGLRLPCCIGINEEEREISQELVAKIIMAYSITPSASTENLDDTIDYRQVAARLRKYTSSKKFCLLETVAETCAQIILNEFPTKHVWIHLEKPCALKVAQPAIEIERRSL